MDGQVLLSQLANKRFAANGGASIAFVLLQKLWVRGEFSRSGPACTLRGFSSRRLSFAKATAPSEGPTSNGGRSSSAADQESIIIHFDHYFYIRHSRDDLGSAAVNNH
jgi:hypothetical protein